MQRRELMALLVTAVLVLVVLGAFYFNFGWQSAPIAPDEHQNTGTNAPNETVPPPNADASGAPAQNAEGRSTNQ